MYSDMKKLLEKLEPHGSTKIVFTPQDTRVATAVLLFRVIVVDGHVREAELVRYREILQDHMNVEPDEMALFEQIVRKLSESDADMTSYTRIVAKMPLETKRDILRFMKEISISDNEFHEFEINLVTRTAQMLGISVN